MFQRVLCSVLLVCISAWPAAARDFVTSDGRPVRNVAVISRLGDMMFVLHMPTFAPAIRSKGWGVPIENWKIDEHVEARVGQALAQRYTVLPLTPTETAGRSATLWYAEKAVEDLRALGPRPEVDAYVLVVLTSAGDIITNASIELLGVGLYHRDDSIGLIGETTAVFAAYEVMVIDAKTGAVIARQDPHTTRFYGVPFQKVDNVLWPGVDKMPDGLQIPPIRDALTALIDESLDWTMKEIAPAL